MSTLSTFETVGFAILGAGMVADYHRQAIVANAARGARLVAVGHYNPARYAEISAELGLHASEKFRRKHNS